jgi:hypothetical protein
MERLNSLDAGQKSVILVSLLESLAADLKDEGPMVATRRAYDFRTAMDLQKDIHRDNQIWEAQNGVHS